MLTNADKQHINKMYAIVLTVSMKPILIDLYFIEKVVNITIIIRPISLIRLGSIATPFIRVSDAMQTEFDSLSYIIGLYTKVMYTRKTDE